MTTITTDHELLTVAEAADRLRVTARFIRMLIAEPCPRCGSAGARSGSGGTTSTTS